MKKWTHIVTIHEDDYHLFTTWTTGGRCSGCKLPVISVKAILDNNIFKLAERNIPDVKYGTIIKVKEFYTRESGECHATNCLKRTIKL